GTLFNPSSISYAIRILLLEKDEHTLNRMIRDSLIEHDGVWHSLLFDSSCSSLDKNKVIDNIYERRSKAHSLMSKGADLIITFGTAWTYALIAEVAGMEGKVVGNCHKLPAHLFERRLLHIDEIVDEWNETISELQLRWPDIKIIFTLSPVRHIKDGLAGNSLSKSILRLGIESLMKKYKSDHKVSFDYFPAFEILNDDLRDYRFYQKDLVHPSDQAVEYIWEKFIETYLDEAQRALLSEGESILQGLSHRSLINNPEKEQQRKNYLLDRLSLLKKKWTEVLVP
ncbi:MAG: GSCFA domain-containing protein, partial [Muribaculaceae bacterium]|nr:GSCFA domain-containing protein [Muribaculaceae bacterium]